MKPGDEVSIIHTLPNGRAFVEGRAVLVDHWHQDWWQVRFADGVTARRRVEASQQDNPAAWVRQFNEERAAHAHR